MSADVSIAAHPLEREVRTAIQVAMLIFVWTVAIGILNGLDLVEFDNEILLSHLHGGTLGWMTLGILGFAMWLFGSGPETARGDDAWIRTFAYIAMGAIPLYVVAFATTRDIARPVAGTAVWITLIAFAVWAVRRAREAPVLTVPHLLALLGLLSSVIGGTFGVINGISIARGWTDYPDSLFSAHPGTMEIGFVVPVAMGVAEWVLRRDEPAEKPARAGKVQVALMFLAFAWLLTFILLDQEEIIGLGILFGIVATGIFYKRVWTHIRGTSWTAKTPSRHAVVGALFIGITFVYVFTIITQAQGDFEAIPEGRAIAFIHLMAIGATTNSLLAFVIHLSRRHTEPGVVDDLIFWGVNVGLAGFAIALTVDVRGLIGIFTPLMGLALLTAVATHVSALAKRPSGSAAPE